MEILFWISTLLLVQTYFGYPIEIVLLARMRPKAVSKGAQTPRVSVVMAVHDGAAEVPAKLDNLFALDYPADRFDVVIACDGCRDASAQIIRDRADARIKVLEFSERRGKAACLNDAVAAAAGEILLFTDVRQRLDVNVVRALAASFSDATVGAVGGELRFEGTESGFSRGVDAYWRYEKIIRQAESNSGSAIGVSGALYALRKALFQPIPEGTVLDDVLIPMNVVRRGKRVLFDADAVAWDRPSQAPARERQRKIRTLAGNLQLVQLAPWLVNPWKNPLWFRFVCHKLLRLLAPWLLLLIALSSAILAPRHGFYAASAAGAVLFAALFLLGHYVPAVMRASPMRLIMAFGYLNLFAAQALIAYVRNPRLHLW
ncbi:MAG: glycosyltransferase family 2 protein [Dokdonella sp.]